MIKIKSFIGAFALLFAVGISFAFTNSNQVSQDDDCWSSLQDEGTEPFDRNSLTDCVPSGDDPCCYKPGPQPNIITYAAPE